MANPQVWHRRTNAAMQYACGFGVYRALGDGTCNWNSFHVSRYCRVQLLAGWVCATWRVTLNRAELRGKMQQRRYAQCSYVSFLSVAQRAASARNKRVYTSLEIRENGG